MLILFYNSFFGTAPNPVDCGPGVEFTSDRRRLPEADVVVFHLPGAEVIGDARRYPGQIWVAWSMESSANTPLVDRPDLMRLFDLTMTFSRKADVWSGYLPTRQQWDEALARPIEAKDRPSPLVMFQSATVDKCGRNAFCAELMRHIPVDSYGRFLKNRELDIPDTGPETKNTVIGRYKFVLGAENTIEEDYVTEKFFQPLLTGAVPVYRGAPNVIDYAPGENCYIDANAFATPAQLAGYLRHLDNDDVAYEKYLAWRTQPMREGFLRLLEKCEIDRFRQLAELVARRGPAPASGSLLPFGVAQYAKAKLARARHVARKIRDAWGLSPPAQRS